MLEALAVLGLIVVGCIVAFAITVVANVLAAWITGDVF